MHISLNHNGQEFIEYTPEALISVGVPAILILKTLHGILCTNIDTAAGAARAAFVSPGSYIDQEYLLAKNEAAEWLANGKEANAIPSSVQDHIDMFGVGAEAAATEIVNTAEAWETALREIRQLRLGGKAAVSRAETIEEAEAAAEDAIEQLKRYRPPKG